MKSKICFSRLDEKTFLINEIKVLLVDETTEVIPLVSVTMITYNHEKYIRQAIEGVLMQKVDFKFVLIIGEDCSKDETRRIVKEYQLLNKDKLILKLPETNLGVNVNSVSNKYFCKGKYVAECEGDDYWTDPYKLQKQVDLMEANDAYGLLYTNYRKLIDNELFENDKEFRSYLNLDGYFQDGCPFLFTGSWLMKNEISNLVFLDSKYGNLPGDVQNLCHFLASKYQVHYLDEVTGVYRILKESASHSMDSNKDKDFVLVKYLLLMKYKNHITKHTLSVQLEKLIQNKFQYFQYFKLGLIGRIGLYRKIAKIKGVNRASRFLIYNVS